MFDSNNLLTLTIATQLTLPGGTRILIIREQNYDEF